MSQHRHDQERSRKPEQGLLELGLVPLQTGSLCTSPTAAEHPLKSREGGKAAVTSASWDALAAPSDSPPWVAMATGKPYVNLSTRGMGGWPPWAQASEEDRNLCSIPC